MGDYTTSNFAKVLFPALAGGLQQRGGVGVVPPVQHQHRGGPQLAGEERPRQGAAGAGAGGRPRTSSGMKVQKDGGHCGDYLSFHTSFAIINSTINIYSSNLL